jgi:hypothetical protein
MNAQSSSSLESWIAKLFEALERFRQSLDMKLVDNKAVSDRP